jgi:hypothetical protein
MTVEELREATAGAENIRFEVTKPLSAESQRRWERAKRGRGRPKVGHGSRAIQITVERGLLAEADAFAEQHGMNRSELISHGLRTILNQA